MFEQTVSNSTKQANKQRHEQATTQPKQQIQVYTQTDATTQPKQQMQVYTQTDALTEEPRDTEFATTGGLAAQQQERTRRSDDLTTAMHVLLQELQEAEKALPVANEASYHLHKLRSDLERNEERNARLLRMQAQLQDEATSKQQQLQEELRGRSIANEKLRGEIRTQTQQNNSLLETLARRDVLVQQLAQQRYELLEQSKDAPASHTLGQSSSGNEYSTPIQKYSTPIQKGNANTTRESQTVEQHVQGSSFQSPNLGQPGAPPIPSGEGEVQRPAAAGVRAVKAEPPRQRAATADVIFVQAAPSPTRPPPSHLAQPHSPPPWRMSAAPQFLELVAQTIKAGVLDGQPG